MTHLEEDFCSVLGKSHQGAKRDFETWALKVFFSLDTKSTPQNGFQRLRPEYQNGSEYTGDSSQGMSQALVPLWGSKNEVVAPKLRFQNTIFEAVLEFVIKFAILVLSIKHQNGFFPEHLAPKSVLSKSVLHTQMVFCQNTFMWRAPKWH